MLPNLLHLAGDWTVPLISRIEAWRSTLVRLRTLEVRRRGGSAILLGEARSLLNAVQDARTVFVERHASSGVAQPGETEALIAARHIEGDLLAMIERLEARGS